MEPFIAVSKMVNNFSWMIGRYQGIWKPSPPPPHRQPASVQKDHVIRNSLGGGGGGTVQVSPYTFLLIVWSCLEESWLYLCPSQHLLLLSLTESKVVMHTTLGLIVHLRAGKHVLEDKRSHRHASGFRIACPLENFQK